MEQEIINFINQFNRENKTNISYNIKDNILTLSQLDTVSTKDNLKELKELILRNYLTEIIEFINEEKGYYEEYPKIELLIEVKFKLKPIQYIINQLQQIRTDNLKTCIYYENIKNTGKNILLLGEIHIITDVDPILNFFNLLIKYKGDNCLDFFLEDMRYLRETYITNPDSMNKIRSFFRDIDSYGVRKHYMNNRLVEGNHGLGFLKTVYNFFACIDIDYSIGLNERYYLIIFLCNFKNELYIDEYIKGEEICFQILSNENLWKVNSDYDNVIDLNIVNVMINFIQKFQIKDLESFYKEIEYNIDSIDDKSEKLFFLDIYKYSYLDEKFSKQINEIDTTFFTINEFLMYFGRRIQHISFNIILFDILTIARMFRKFNYGKNRIPICDSEEKSLKNIVLYNGDSHNLNIKNFIEEVILKNDRNEIENCRKINENYIPKFNYFNFFKKK